MGGSVIPQPATQTPMGVASAPQPMGVAAVNSQPQPGYRPNTRIGY